MRVEGKCGALRIPRTVPLSKRIHQIGALASGFAMNCVHIFYVCFVYDGALYYRREEPQTRHTHILYSLDLRPHDGGGGRVAGILLRA